MSHYWISELIAMDADEMRRAQARIKALEAENAALREAMGGALEDRRLVMEWKSWQSSPPEPGTRVVVLCDDGISTQAGLVIDADEEGKVDLLHAEDGMAITWKPFFAGAMWAELPHDYELGFMADDGRDY